MQHLTFSITLLLKSRFHCPVKSATDQTDGPKTKALTPRAITSNCSVKTYWGGQTVRERGREGERGSARVEGRKRGGGETQTDRGKQKGGEKKKERRELAGVDILESGDALMLSLRK